MKKICFAAFLLLIIGSSLTHIYAQQRLVINLPKVNLLPDVMNKVNVLEMDINGRYKNVTYDLDTFPAFANFPKSVTGQSFEGGIFCQMDGDPQLEIVYGIGNTVQAWKIDGSSVPGWPVTLSYNAEGAPAFGDIDGDGQPEIVINARNFTSSAGAIYAFHKNGTPVTNFPIVNGAPTRTVVLADLDNDGKMEIISNKRLSSSGEISVYRGDGTVFPGWPKTINHVPASSSAVGDITGDGVPEIVSESYNSLYAWDKNGNIITGYPFTMPNGDNNSYSAPVLADMDGDGIREIVFGTHKLGAGGYVYILKNDGSVLTGWPKYATEWIYGPPVVGLIDNDNLMDVLIGDQVASGVPADYVYGWNKNGSTLSGFPIGPINAVNNQVSVGDIDGDNQYDLIIDDNTTTLGYGKYLAYHTNGTPVTGWPQPTLGTSFFNFPCLADLNLDNNIDMVGAGVVLSGSGTTNVYEWGLGAAYHPNKIINPVWQFNVRHTGVFGEVDPVGVSPVTNSVPSEFKLYQNYPNPFNPSTKIQFSVPSAGKISIVKIVVYDVLGRETAQLLNESKAPGNYEILWDASSYSSGVYFYSYIVNGVNLDTKKLILMK